MNFFISLFQKIFNNIETNNIFVIRLLGFKVKRWVSDFSFGFGNNLFVPHKFTQPTKNSIETTGYWAERRDSDNPSNQDSA